LQVNCPEFTLATMLPIVKVTEAARVRKTDAKRDMLESNCNDALKDLKIETVPAKLEPVVIEAVILLRTETIRDKLEASVIEAVKVLKIEA